MENLCAEHNNNAAACPKCWAKHNDQAEREFEFLQEIRAKFEKIGGKKVPALIFTDALEFAATDDELNRSIRSYLEAVEL